MASAMVANIGAAVVAPAGGVPHDSYQAGLEILAARYHLVHVYGPDPASLSIPSRCSSYLAASDRARVDAMNLALRDPAVDVIFCARGGYGTMRILGQLDADALRRRRTPIVGFSDITALHAWAACEGVPTIHGPVVTQLARLPQAQRDALFALVETGAKPQLDDLATVLPGQARGRLLGGNLTLLSHLCGTPYLPSLDGCILLLEDVGERPYRLDRMLTQLALAGHLRAVAGIVLGEFLECDDPAKEGATMTSARDVLHERVTSLGIPIVEAAPIGHGNANLALPLGLDVELDATAGTLRYR